MTELDVQPDTQPEVPRAVARQAKNLAAVARITPSHEVFLLSLEDNSNSLIALMKGIHRNTVAKILKDRLNEHQADYKERESDAIVAFIEVFSRTGADVTGVRASIPMT